MRRPDLSVIIVTHNGRDLALKTLRSAIAKIGDTAIQWIVVDSGSADGTPDVIESMYSDVQVVRSVNRGFAAGNNVGLALARGRYILLLNPDVEIASGTLAELVDAMDARPEVGVASVVHRSTQEELQWSIRRFPSVARDIGEALCVARWPVLRTLQELENRPGAYEREHSVDWLVGAFLIVRAEAAAEVGAMDERFFLYSEEVDWCYRFNRAGWDVRHLPVMTIVHHAGRRDRGDLMAQLAQSRKLFAQKHYGAIRAAGIRGALSLGHAIRIAGLAPHAIRDGGARDRMRAERRALAVQLGLSGPPMLAAPQTPGFEQFAGRQDAAAPQSAA